MIVGELEEWTEFDSEEEYDNFLRFGSRGDERPSLRDRIAQRPVLGIIPRALQRPENSGLDSGKRKPILKRAFPKLRKDKTVPVKKAIVPKQDDLLQDEQIKARIPEEIPQKELKQKSTSEDQATQKEEPKVMMWVIGGVLVLATLTAVGFAIKQLSKKQQA